MPDGAFNHDATFDPAGVVGCSGSPVVCEPTSVAQLDVWSLTPYRGELFGITTDGWGLDAAVVVFDDAVLDYGGGERGRRRARAAALLLLALPGGAYVYQGDELGLEEVLDLPDEVLQDPTFARTGGADRGRDGCRVPMPWSGDAPPFGFGTGAAPWLPQPPAWRDRTVERQRADPGSTWSLYRDALALRRSEPALGDGDLRWVEPVVRHDGVLAFRRPPDIVCVLNAGRDRVPLAEVVPTHVEVLLASEPLGLDGALEADDAVWLRARGT